MKKMGDQRKRLRRGWTNQGGRRMRFEEFKNGIMKDLEWTIRWVGGDQDPRTKSKQKKM